MPVEPTRIKGRLRELFPKANLSNKRLDEISARLAKKPVDEAEDSAIDLFLTEANDIYSFEEMAKDEHRLATLESKLKEPNPTPNPTPATNPETTPKPSEDMPAWAKELTEGLKNLQSGKIQEQKAALARKEFDKNETFKALSEKGREFYFKQLQLDSETPIADQLIEIEGTHKEIVQAKADANDYTGKPPAYTLNDKASKEMINKIVG